MEENNKKKANAPRGLKITIWLLVGIALGALVGLIAGAFMHAQHHLIVFLWDHLPEYLGSEGSIYVFLLCVVGGLVVGLGRKYIGDEPKDIHTVIHNMRTGEDVPQIKTVPAAFLVSLLSLGFGGALGPEAALAGISIGLGSWVGGVLAKLAARFDLDDLKKPWSGLAGYAAMAGGMAVFVLVSKSIFANNYAFFAYDFSLSLNEILTAAALGLLGVLIGKTFAWFGEQFGKLLAPLKNKPVAASMLGGAIFGVLGMVSPLILFSGQTGLGTLFEAGLGMSGLFLILIGVLKMAATKSNTAAGWKGGEFFPVMFSSAAIAVGLANLIPGIHPMMAIAALMAATVTVVMDNIFLAVPIVLLFLPVDLFVPMVVAALVALAAGKKLVIQPKLETQSVPVESKE